ncbi:MAG: hypothetical protein PHI70_09820, partial [Proteiniphilum sp.]|nr:hypothetical protein [Proteiniphilum sp.]MDD4417064.1 hypothetical protein [Proteiniphilum sp.]
APVYITSLENPVSISADRSEKFWINFHSPENALPGVYTGTITLQTKDASQEIPLKIRILPFKLPEPKGLTYGMYYMAYNQVFGNLKTVDAMRAQVQHDLADMRMHGMTSIGICNGVDPSSYTVSDKGEVKFHFDGSTLFELTMEAYKEFKFPEPVIDMSKAAQKATKGHRFGTPEYDSIYVSFYKELFKEAASKGWSAMYVQPYDEPGWHSQQERNENLHLLKVLKATGIPTEIDGPGDNYFVNIAGPHADFWNYNAALSSEDDVRKAQSEGRKVTLYNYDVSGWLGECGRWATGLFNWKFGLDGAFNWVYYGGRADFYNDLDGNNGDWMHYYPKTAAHPGGSSIGWENIRQGINDRHYFELCQQTISRAKAKGGVAAKAAEEADKMLEELRTSLSNNLAAQYKNMDWTMYLPEEEAKKHSFIPPIHGKISAYASGEYKYGNNLKLEDYDKIRWMAAAHIVHMMEKMEEISPTGITVPPYVKICKTIPKPEFAQKTINIPSLKSAPVINGQITLNEWKDAAEVQLTLNDVFEVPQMPTKVHCGLHNDVLYIAFICTEEVIDFLTINATKQGDNVTSDDCVEVFLDPGITQSKFYHVAVNPLGIYLTDGSYKDWNPDIKTAATINQEKQEWVVELGIPVKGMELAPRFGVNFNRERRPKDALLELSSWVMTRGGFGRPERFGTAIIDD